jgi:hypothetical protein
MTRTDLTPAVPTGTVPDAAPRGTTLRRRAAGATAIAAGAVGLAGFLSSPWEESADTAAYLHTLVAHPIQAMVSMVVLHYGYLLFVPVAFVLARLARGRAPRLAATGLVLSVLGSGLSGFVVTDAYDQSIALHLPMQTAVAVSEGVSAGGMLAVAVPTIAGTMLGLVLLLVAMWRARWLSIAPAVVMLAGWVVSYQAHSMVLACSGFALVAVALVLAGARILRATDPQFAAGSPA